MTFISLLLITGISAYFSTLGHSLGDANVTRFITLSFTASIFSINFSFIVYSFSKFKAIINKIPLAQILLSIVIMILPILNVVLYLQKSVYSKNLILFTLPFSMFGSVLLMLVAYNQVNPISIIRKFSIAAKKDDYFFSISMKLLNRLKDIDDLKLTNITESPTHEHSDDSTFVILSNDPFDKLVKLVAISTEILDLEVFEKSLTEIIQVFLKSNEYKNKDKKGIYGYKVDRALVNNFQRGLSLVNEAIIKHNHSKILSEYARNIYLKFIKESSQTKNQTSEKILALVYLCHDLTVNQLSNGNFKFGIATIVAYRQLSHKGITSRILESNEIEERLFEHDITIFPRLIKSLGTNAIKKDGTDFLYRSLDALGWLGCTAMKENHPNIVRECISGLAQLGREAKYYKLECHWDRCAITPLDHAAERLTWITTWVLKIEKGKRGHYLESLSEGFSRLYGKSTVVEIDDDEKIGIVKSKEDHISSYMTNSFSREINYSDYSFLKEMQLY